MKDDHVKGVITQCVRITGKPYFLWANIIRWRVAEAKRRKLPVAYFVRIKKVVG